MSRMPSKKATISQQPDDERQRRIEKLREQVRRFDEKGRTDTPHHQELARLLGQSQPVENAPEGDTEEVKNGE